jgi:hypothetical protein
MVMYSRLPTRHRRAVKTSLTMSWLASAGAGLSAIILSPTTIISELGTWGTLASGFVLALGAMIASAGVAFARYRWEWVAAWVSATALAPYLVTVWALVIVDTATRSTQAYLVTSLLGFYISRAISCAAHAAKLRAEHQAGILAVDSATDEGERDGDDRAGGQ